MNKQIRVRFAPSPTGYLHVGGLRTALYNFLFAKKYNGKFILRIEDTDRNRFVEGAIDNLIDTLKWADLNFDEGPLIEGEFGPYIQSQRLDIYKKYALELIKTGNAYYCFCSPERLQRLREEQEKLKLTQIKYDKYCLNLIKDEIKEKLDNNLPYVIRLNVVPNSKIIFNDIIRGEIEFDSNNIDDQVLLKSDGYPTYHLANVVDDHLMQITHVIRGEEWLSSTPKHILLYKAFNWEIPQFAHLPLLLNPDKTKLSKRQGDVAVEAYREKGYLKEALINFVALLGWNAGDDREFYLLDDLINAFSLDRVNKSGAVFDVVKLNALNAAHLRNKSNFELLEMLKIELSKSEFKDLDLNNDVLLLIIEAMKERVTFVSEFISSCKYFYKAPEDYEQKSIEKNWKPDTAEHMLELAAEFSKLENPTKLDYENTIAKLADILRINKGRLIHPLRLAISGQSTGAGIFDILFIVGKDEVIRRIKLAVERIKT